MFLPHFPQNFGASVNTRDKLPRMNNSVGGFYTNSVTNGHPSICKLIPLLIEEEILVRKRGSFAE